MQRTHKTEASGISEAHSRGHSRVPKNPMSSSRLYYLNVDGSSYRLLSSQISCCLSSHVAVLQPKKLRRHFAYPLKDQTMCLSRWQGSWCSLWNTEPCLCRSCLTHGPLLVFGPTPFLRRQKKLWSHFGIHRASRRFYLLSGRPGEAH